MSSRKVVFLPSVRSLDSSKAALEFTPARPTTSQSISDNGKRHRASLQ